MSAEKVDASSPTTRRNRLFELCSLFLKLGVTAFGGPAAHIAFMEEEVVRRRAWIDRKRFLDLVGATNLIPGPNSTEMTMQIGFARQRWAGLVVAGASFILPAAIITLAIAVVYVRYGTLPQVEPVLRGIKPVVVGIIAMALIRLSRTALSSWKLLPVVLFTCVLLVTTGSEVVALVGGGIVGATWLLGLKAWHETRFLAPILLLSPMLLQPKPEVELWKIGLFFLKVGAILYGSGYVLFAFLEADLVSRFQWLTQQQLIDAIAVGQLTPGPILTTATFVGYLVGGIPGAIVATLGIFLPAFLFVGIVHPWIDKLRNRPVPSAFLDSVNVAAVVLMVIVTFELARSSVINLPTFLIALASLVLIWKFRLNPAILVVVGGALGFIL